MSRATSSPFTRLHPPAQQQIDAILRGINSLADHLGELDLKVEFVMRQIRMGRAVPGSMLDASGKPRVEHLALIDLYACQREAFAEMLMKERDAITRAQRTHQGGGTGERTGLGLAPSNGASGESAHANVDADANADADADTTLVRGGGIVLVGGGGKGGAS